MVKPHDPEPIFLIVSPVLVVCFLADGAIHCEIREAIWLDRGFCHSIKAEDVGRVDGQGNSQVVCSAGSSVDSTER